ncbi:MAG TPA: CHAT domain-containing protein [Marmoricola sp.]
MPSAQQLYQRGQVAHRSGRYATARRLLSAARARSTDPDLVARIELALGYVEGETGDADGGLARCTAALGIEGASPLTRGLIWSQLALLHMRSGEEERALADFAEALPLLGEDSEHLGRAYLNRGNLHLQRHDPVAAVTDLEAASRHLRVAGQEVQRAKAEHNLGYAHLLTGDLVGALRLMESAAHVLAPLSAVNRSVCEQDRAEVLLAAGRPREAIRALEAAAAAYGSRRLRRFQAECELVLARTLLPEDPRRARQVARQSARRFRSHGSEGWAVRADGLAVVAEIETGARASSVLARADGLVAELRAADHDLDADRLALHAARLSVRRGECSDAERRLAAVRVGRRTPVDTRLLAREVRAELARASGRTGRARQQVRTGLADLHAWQAGFGSLDLQSTLVGHGNRLARLGLELALADGSPGVVFEWSERARALASRVGPVRPPRDPRLAADLAELRSLADGSSSPRLREELRERVRQQSWYGAGGGRIGEPAAYDDLRAALRHHDAALVAHIVLGDRVTALVVAAERAAVLPLADSAAVRALLDRVAVDLDLAASRSAGPMATAVLGSLRADLARAAELLVQPLLDIVGDSRLVLTPSALLAGTPWTLLPGLVGRPLTVPASATRWLELVGHPLPRDARVGLVAGPGVPRAEPEVARAAAQWSAAEVLLGEKATAAQVSSLAEGVDLLHVAGHGHHSLENPLFSSIDLADGPWFGYDVDTLVRTPGVVVLSACELGRASVRSAEETVGMTAAWLHAGARTALSSPALVADAVAGEALAEWHRLVAAGLAPADALARLGAAWSRADGAPLPFVCFGAGW